MAIPIFLLSLGILFWQSRNYIREQSTDHAASVLNSATQRLRTYMNTIETATNSNEWLVVENFKPEALLSMTERIVRLNRHVNGCSITTEPDVFPEYGHYFSAYSVREKTDSASQAEVDSVTTVREEEYDYFSRIWYKKPKELGRACWVEPFDDFNEISLYTEERIASYCKPLYTEDGSMLGVISTDLSLRNLAASVDSVGLPYPSAYFMLIGRDGRYFIHPNPTMLYFERTIYSYTDPSENADQIALGHEMTAGNQGHMYVKVDGEPCLVCYRPVPGTEWSLALVCPEREMLKSYHQLGYIIALIIAVGLLVIMLLCLHAVSHAISPVNKLLSQIKLIADGQYEVFIPHTRREDAVGQLQNSFAAMQESLNFHMGSIRYTTDVTQQRNEELERATQLAEEALRQKTTFIHHVTHQIRTPLNIIMGFAQIISEGMALPKEEMASIKEMMVHNSNTLKRLVQMLFDSSDSGLSEELNSHKQEVVPCNEVARESISYTQSLFAGIAIHFETDAADDFSILTNKLYLMRSLRELLYNAAKYSDGKHLAVRITHTDSVVKFCVEDTGPGISEEKIEQMFKPFTKIDDLSEGLGLGLPLAKRHAMSLGGDLTLDTSYTQGCRFVIELPINNDVS
jgi:signal transduction histidine kinase